MLYYEKEQSKEEDPWHNWHKHDKASGTAADVTAQWQKYLSLCPLWSVVVAKPTHAELKLQQTPWR